MNSKLSLLLIVILIAGLVSACSDEVVMPESPAMSNGVTDSQGTVVVETGPYTVSYNTVNSAGNPVPSTYVMGYLLHEYIACIASNSAGNYFPAVKVVSLDDLQSSGFGRINVYENNYGVNSSARAMDTEFTIELVLENRDLAVNGYEVEPANMNLAVSDEWLELNSVQTDMAGLYDLAQSSAFHNSVYIYLAPHVAQATGAGRQTASFVLSEIYDLTTFNVVAGVGLGLYEGDSVTVATIAYQDSLTPVLYISAIDLHRDYFKQITLTWGENPGDLDSHLWTPSIADSVYHIFFADQGSRENAPFANLDVDDMNSYGPEHITIFDEFAGTYTFAVFHWGGEGTIATSEAQVSVVDSAGNGQTFNVPNQTAQDRYWWHVCSIDGTTGAITPINIISPDPPFQGFIASSMPEKNYGGNE